MLKINKVLASALCAIALLGAGCAGGKIDQSSPEAAASTFMSAIQNQDKTTAKALAAPGSSVANDFEDGWEDVQRTPLKSFTVKGAEGDVVTVEMVLTVDGKDQTTTNDVRVVEIDGKWYVDNL